MRGQDTEESESRSRSKRKPREPILDVSQGKRANSRRDG